jgi:hypothetical protein
MTLDYRSPQTGEPRARAIKDALLMEETASYLLVFAKLFFGVIFCFLPPLLFIGFFGRVFARHTHLSRQMMGAYVFASAVLIPIMFVIQIHRKREYHFAAKPEEHTVDLEIGKRLFSFHLGDTWVTLVDVLLFGPQLIMSLVEQITRKPPGGDMLSASAEIVVTLLDSPHSLPVTDLAGALRTPEDVRVSLQYLERRGWVWVSPRRDRVGISGSVRRQFRNLQ